MKLCQIIEYEIKRCVLFWYWRYCIMVDIHGPFESRGTTWCLGGVDKHF